LGKKQKAGMEDQMRTIDRFLHEKINILGITLEFIDIFFAVAIIMLGLVARFAVFGMMSGDYELAFADWMKEIRNCHAAGVPYIGVEPGGADHLSTFDYNCLYQYLIVFLNLFNNGGGNDMFLVKMSDCIFDVVLAVTTFRIIYEMTRDSHKSMMAMGVMMVVPTVLLNSAAWAQNDAIYTSFLMLSFLSLLRKKDLRTWLYFAIAFCWKQQAIFLAPVLIIAWLRNKTKIRYILCVPVMYVLVIIPAAIAGALVPSKVTVDIASLADTGNVSWISDFAVNGESLVLEPVGRSFGSLLGIYGHQVSMFSRLTMNYPNIYTIIYSDIDKTLRQMIITCGEVFTVMLLGILAYYLYNKKFKDDKLFYLTLVVFVSQLVVYCLPCMHERYGYVAEVFAFIYGMFGFRRLILAIVLQFITLVTYTRFLWGASSSLTTANLVVFAFMLLGIILLLGKDLYSQVHKKELKIEKAEEKLLS
jgi:Gpi18-like mannosyltransferase